MRTPETDYLWRIEDRDRDGVYTSFCTNVSHIVYNILEEDSLSSQRHPAPHNDSLLVSEVMRRFGYNLYDTRDQFKYGFRDERALRSWFHKDEAIRYLHNCRMYLAHYKGPCAHGHTQSVIDINNMTLVRKYSLLSLLT